MFLNNFFMFLIYLFLLFAGDFSQANSISVSYLEEIGLHELSGLSSSRVNRNIVWAHNDSGNSAELFALDENGHLLLLVSLPVEFFDAEDISISNCPESLGFLSENSCIWIADTGDNRHIRNETSLWVFEEPLITREKKTIEIDREDIIKINLKFNKEYSSNLEDQILNFPNIEALTFESSGNRFWLFEKTDYETSRIWEGNIEEVNAFKEIFLQEVAGVNVSAISEGEACQRELRITAADLNEDDNKLLIRTYSNVFLFDLVDLSMMRNISSASFRKLPLNIEEPQGEAITFVDQNSIVTASEKNNGYQPGLSYWELL